MQPVSLYALKLHCRIDTDDEDVSLSAYLSVATESVQQHLGTATPLDNTAPAPVKAAPHITVYRQAAAVFNTVKPLHQCNGFHDKTRQLHGNLTYHRLLAPYRVYA
jgi:uncharacterized phage protein (predicted DNA packaging)